MEDRRTGVLAPINGFVCAFQEGGKTAQGEESARCDTIATIREMDRFLFELPEAHICENLRSERADRIWIRSSEQALVKPSKTRRPS
jgi:hypothetical protein